MTDEVARLGGDEFLAVLTDLSDVQAVYQAVERILSSLDLPIQLEGGQEVRADASIGIALSPGDGTDAETLLSHADTAMYEAKAQGRFTFSFYTPAMTEEAQRRHQVTTLLRRALERGEFRLWLQPRVDMVGGGLVGAEALLRWDSPELGFLSPKDFLSLAEKSGVMTDVGDWVLRRACALWRELADQGLLLPRLAINVSSAQLSSECFIRSLKAAMDESRVSAGVLNIEISETGLLAMDKAAERLSALHEMGVGVALDDFGAGLSSLKRLANLPLDVIKIDRSYASQVGGEEDGALITRIVINLAETLGLEVVAEGVEQEGQSRLLMDCGCHIGQGYHFGKPMPAGEFLRAWTLGTSAVPEAALA